MEKRRRFTAEFRREAIGLLKNSGRPVATIARELGVSGEPTLQMGGRCGEGSSEAFRGSGWRPTTRWQSCDGRFAQRAGARIAGRAVRGRSAGRVTGVIDGPSVRVRRRSDQGETSNRNVAT